MLATRSRPLPSAGASSPADQRLRRAMLVHSDCLARILRRHGIAASDVEEIVQDALHVLARRLAEVPERSERSFLISTALRMASSFRRSRARAPGWDDRDPDTLAELPQPFADPALDPRTFRALLATALNALDEEERSVFVLGELEEMSRHEVAQVLAISEGTVATRLARANSVFERAVRRALRGGQRAEALSLRPSKRGRAEYSVVGPHRYENVDWGSDQVSGHFEQRLLSRERNGQPRRGWTWRWPGLSDLSLAFPEVVTGWKPWHGGTPTTAGFPLRIDSLRRLLVHYDVETVAHGRYNLAVDAWITGSPHWSTAPNPHAILAELLVVLDHHAGARPAGQCIDRLTIDAEPYELFRAPSIGARHRNGSGWPCFSFLGRGRTPRGSLDLGAFARELVRAGHLKPEHHIASVELGNEIMGGAGTTWVERFEVET